MVQIIEEQRKPKFSDQLMQGFSNLSREASTEIPKFFGERLMEAERTKRQKLEDEQIARLTGEDISGIQDPKIRQQVVADLMKGNIQNVQKSAPLQAGLDTIRRMREIGAKGKLGKTLTRGIFGGEQAKDRAEYEQLGKSLIALSTTIPIRNRLEFETLAEKLYDPSIRDRAREGILDAMERIISHGLQQHGGSMQMQPMEQSQQKERPPLESFHG